MNMKKTITTAVALALGASLAFAGPGEGKRGMRHGKHGMHGDAGMARMAEKLNLTDAQKTQLQEQRKNFRESNQARFQTHRDTMRQFREAKKAGDTARADALKATLEIQKGELQQLRKAQHDAMLSILTAEQRAQLEAMKAEHRSRRDARRQNRQ
jgi:Spy/CpxP family protein refolding chaperone